MKRQGSQKLVFISFADKKYSGSFGRLKRETEAFPFDERLFLTDDDLPDDFIRSLKLWKYSRGFGYWRWKPFIVERKLKEMDEGDILFYSDAGNHWNDKGLKRFDEYVAMLNEAPDDGCVLAFQEPFIEKDWSKGELLQYLGFYHDEKTLMSWQLWGGAFAVRKTSQTYGLISQWNELQENNYGLITDKASEVPNLVGFIEHRHDQSTFSLLVKKSKHIEIPWYEVESLHPGGWEALKDYPVQGRRLKEKDRSMVKRIKRLLTKPLRFLRGQYLIHIEGFQFRSKHPCF